MNVLADVLVDDKDLKQQLMKEAAERGTCELMPVFITHCTKLLSMPMLAPCFVAA